MCPWIRPNSLSHDVSSRWRHSEHHLSHLATRISRSNLVVQLCHAGSSGLSTSGAAIVIEIFRADRKSSILGLGPRGLAVLILVGHKRRLLLRDLRLRRRQLSGRLCGGLRHLVTRDDAALHGTSPFSGVTPSQHVNFTAVIFRTSCLIRPQQDKISVVVLQTPKHGRW